MEMTKDNPFWTNELNAETFGAMADAKLEKAKKAITDLLAVEGARTIENTLAPYDEALTQLDAAGEQSSLMTEVHPDENFRSRAESVSQKVSALATELSLNQDVFNALSQIETSGADAETKHYLKKTLRDFRLNGVDKDDATREKIKALRDELVLIGQEFGRNIRDDKTTVTVENADELEGLPADYIQNHPPDVDGKIILTTEYPDYVPVMTFAKSEDLRRRMNFAFNNRAYPQNMKVLDRMTQKRFELANLLGYPTWADYITADKMIETSANASNFVTKIVEASGARAENEYQELLARKRKDVPKAERINPWEAGYYSELLRKSEYNFDSQSVRPYFQYERVKEGVLNVTGKLFGVEFRRVENAPVWHPAVECWEMFENGEITGRFYLDMHPRPAKYSHAAMFGIKTGIAGKQIPEVALVCNFPGGAEGDEGLMLFDDVNTFFHEFGHLLHYLFAGRQKWIGIGGISTEWDFVEVPSQMLEEWTRDAATLQTFARHYQTDEPIPTELVEQMNRAADFGKGLAIRRQMVFARYALSLYDRDPQNLDTDELAREIYSNYSLFPMVEGTHFQTAFGHLDGYSAIYYTYMWSLVLAKDIFSRFDKANLLEPEVAANYRRKILAAGSSKPANELVEDFLGRKSDFAAYQNWLNEAAA